VQRDFFRTGLLINNDITFAVPFNSKKRDKKAPYRFPLTHIEANIGAKFGAYPPKKPINISV